MRARDAVLIGGCLVLTALLLIFGRGCALESDAGTSEVFQPRPSYTDGGR